MNFLKMLFGFGGDGAFKNVNGADFERLMNEAGDAVLIDVRTVGEFKSGAIPSAKNMDILSGDFERKVATLDKNKTYFLYCRSGARSGKAAKLLTSNGFEKVYNLSGGVGAWQGKLNK